MFRKALSLALIAAPALADTVALKGSTVTLRPTERPGAMAEVEFYNDASNWQDDNGDHVLALDGLEVGLQFTWNAAGSDDRIELTPPEGVICDPRDCTLDLPEGQAGVVHLFSVEGVGM
jgi:hypothetical protein